MCGAVSKNVSSSRLLPSAVSPNKTFFGSIIAYFYVYFYIQADVSFPSTTSAKT